MYLVVSSDPECKKELETMDFTVKRKMLDNTNPDPALTSSGTINAQPETDALFSADLKKVGNSVVATIYPKNGFYESLGNSSVAKSSRPVPQQYKPKAEKITTVVWGSNSPAGNVIGQVVIDKDGYITFYADQNRGNYVLSQNTGGAYNFAGTPVSISWPL